MKSPRQQILDSFETFLKTKIEHAAKERENFLTHIKSSHYIAEMFQFYIREITKAETIEKICREYLDFLNSKTGDTLLSKLDTISSSIDSKRQLFHLDFGRTTCAIRNEVERYQTEALHAFLFSPNSTSDSDLIQEFCLNAVNADI